MTTVKGNLIDLAEQGHFDLIVHGANCFNTMNSGIAKEIRDRYPVAYEEDCKSTKGDKQKLGGFTWCLGVTDDHTFVIVNGYTQYDYGYDGNQFCDYDAIRSVFRCIKNYFGEKKPTLRIGYPKIGCGLAGGDWDVVSKIIDEELEGMDHTYVEFG